MWDARENSEYMIKWLMFVDDTALVNDSEEKLGRLVQEFGRVCERRMRETRKENELNISLNNRQMEEVETYRYLGLIY